jgi:uncharacterized protein HemX
MELDGGLLYKIIVTLGSLGGLFWAFVTWIKGRQENKRSEIQSKANVVNTDLTELKTKIRDLERADLDQQESIMEAEKKLEKLDTHLHDLIMLMLDRK